MTTAGPTRVSRHLLESFVEAGASMSTLTTAYPVGADSRRTIAANLVPDAVTENRADAQGTLSHLDDAIPMQRTGQGSWEGYLLPSGAAGTAPDIAVDLTSGGFRVVTGNDTTVAGTSSTTTRVDVASTSGWSVGSLAAVALPSGAIEARFVTAVDSVGTDLVVSPALSETPNVNGAGVAAGVAYWVNDSRHDSEDCLTLWVSANRFLKRAIGYVPDRFGFQLGGNRAGRVSHSGPARQVDYIGQTLLNGAINNVVTTITVDDPDIVPDDVATNNVSLTITADGAAAAIEHVIATAKSGNDLTVTRAAHSSSAVSHLDNAIVVPYTPTGVYAGSPVPATTGDVIIGGLEQQMGTVDIDCSFPIGKIEGIHGDEYGFAGYVSEKREISWSIAGWTDIDTMELVHDAIRRGSPEVHIQQGTTAGSIIAAYSPSVLFKVPDANPSDSPTPRVQLEGSARGTTAQDEFAIGFV